MAEPPATALPGRAGRTSTATPGSAAAPDRSEHARLRAVIIELLDRRGPGKTICPSDAARALAGANFRPLMEAARAAAAELVVDGQIEVTQRGAVVDITQARGPIRLRHRRS